MNPKITYQKIEWAARSNPSTESLILFQEFLKFWIEKYNLNIMTWRIFKKYWRITIHGVFEKIMLIISFKKLKIAVKKNITTTTVSIEIFILLSFSIIA